MTVNGCDGNSTSDVSAREDLEIVQTDSKSESGSSKGAVPVTLGVTPAHRMYRGEKDANYRSGFGVYVYPNNFFRYEGEWKDGKKHGHGKLIMRDGSYYEGNFLNGEIVGRGTRFFASDGRRYTGDFSCGECHGEGQVEYSDGSTYHGQFESNKREGFGVLSCDKGTYEGQFHSNLCHGDGTYNYKNGDVFSGYWVQGKKQGHGKLQFSNGTTYEGQWRCDKYNGEGELRDSSGATYSGLWCYHVPSCNPVKLSISIPPDSSNSTLNVSTSEDGLTAISVAQGEAFSIEVVVVSSEDQVVTQVGGLQIAAKALYKHIPAPPDYKEPLLEIVQQTELPVENTPVYAAVSHPITDLLEFMKEVDRAVGSHLSQQNQNRKTTVVNATDNKTVEHNNGPNLALPRASMSESVQSCIAGMAADALLGNQGKNEDTLNQDSNRSTNRDNWTAPSAQTQLITEGTTRFPALVIPCAPLGYRPHDLEDFLDQQRRHQLHSKGGGGSTHLLGVGTGGGVATKKQVTELNYSRMTEAELRRTVSCEKSARPGEYVVKIEDVTEPPFLGRRLEPAYLLINVLAKTPTLP
ncbi:MORN repeat-containing protein 1-like isoform X2 [Symsagittifera roscoffensis]|uniref:MORN repeat-containing protein 1-like isoform X2 n=1 Tax=Symsagittifera roscoffensis TaxID=84072 RepID=UPI00307BB13F